MTYDYQAHGITMPKRCSQGHVYRNDLVKCPMCLREERMRNMETIARHGPYEVDITTVPGVPGLYLVDAWGPNDADPFARTCTNIYMGRDKRVAVEVADGLAIYMRRLHERRMT